jgi:hypothetical protein
LLALGFSGERGRRLADEQASPLVRVALEASDATARVETAARHR